MAITLGNRIKVSTSTTGTGTITLGSAETGYQTFANGGISDGDEVRFVIEDGTAFEISKGTYTHSGTTLSRTLLESTTGALLNLSGSAKVFVTAAADDLMLTDGGTFTGDVTFDSADLRVGDNDEILLGDGNDLRLKHNSNQSTIRHDIAAGALRLQGDTMYLESRSGAIYMLAVNGGAVSLSHANSTKFTTTSSGIQTTGTVNVNGAYTLPTSDGSANQVLTTDGSGSVTFATVASAASNTGTGNFIGGTNAGASLASGGEYNTLLGYNAGNLTTTGDYNVAIGDDALRANQTGSNNVAIGQQAGEEFLFNESIFIGKFAGKERSSGNHNIALGRYTCGGYSSTLSSGWENICIGVDNGAQLTSGASNILMGSTTGFGLTTADYNVMIGDAAGYNTNADYNVFIGADAGKLVTSGAKNVVIGSYDGNQDGLDIRTSSNRIVLSDGDGNIGMYIDGSQDAHFDGNVTAYSTTISDERLKTDIERIENALDKVSELNGYTFTYKKDGKASAGVIAQEVEKVLPSAVSEKEIPLQAEQGEQYKIVQYDQIHGLLIEAIKDLKKEIEALKNASSK